MEHFSFVILHYLAEIDTIECINSIIENVNCENYDIVVVDNASYNDSMQKIKDKYKGTKNIHFIESKENLGFAKGNNLGFMYAKSELHSDFICLINNDTIINQKNFITKVIDIYKNEGFAVLGPNIIARNGVHQNPVRKELITIEKLRENLKTYERLIKRCERRTYKYYDGIKNIIKEILKLTRTEKYFRKNSLKSSKMTNEEYSHIKGQENVQLHGSCLIFSPEYISKYDGLYSETFMFMEEDILFFMSQRDHFKMLYSPEVEIFHKEDASTDYLMKSNIEKRKFIYRNHILSGEKLLNLMEQKNNIGIK